MVSIPLADVVAFLRPRGALGVLEGAPFFYSNGPTDPPMMPIPGTGMETWDGEPVRLLGHEHHAMLYLGDGEICPAAEGWAARVLALAKGYSLAASPYFLHVHDGVVVLLGYDGGEMADLGVWMHPEIRGSAARLAAVLTYEMERAK